MNHLHKSTCNEDETKVHTQPIKNLYINKAAGTTNGIPIANIWNKPKYRGHRRSQWNLEDLKGVYIFLYPKRLTITTECHFEQKVKQWQLGGSGTSTSDVLIFSPVPCVFVWKTQSESHPSDAVTSFSVQEASSTSTSAFVQL